MKKLSDVVDNEVFKKTKFNTIKTKVNNLEKRIPDAATSVYINQCNTGKQNLEKIIGNVNEKIPYTSGLVTTTVLNTKTSEVENKITSAGGLVKKKQIMTLIQKTGENISLLLIVKNLRVTYLM